MTLVRYLATPVGLFIELQGVLDGLQREVQLSSLAGSHAVGDEVVEGIVVRREELVDVRVALYDQAVAARRAGRVIADLEAELPGDSVDHVLAVIAATRDAEAAAEDGRLLSLPIDDELRRFQTWLFDQVEIQLRGGDPTPYEPAPDATTVGEP